MKVKEAVVFTNWLWLKGALGKVAANRDVILDLSETRLVDHTVMEKLHEMEAEYEHRGRSLRVVGLEDHSPMSDHPQAARKKAAGRTGTDLTGSFSAEANEPQPSWRGSFACGRSRLIPYGPSQGRGERSRQSFLGWRIDSVRLSVSITCSGVPATTISCLSP